VKVLCNRRSCIGLSPLCADNMFSKRENKEALAGGKGVVREGRSEVSHTAKVCTDPSTLKLRGRRTELSEAISRPKGVNCIRGIVGRIR
jgi:hypothetical protein